MPDGFLILNATAVLSLLLLLDKGRRLGHITRFSTADSCRYWGVAAVLISLAGLLTQFEWAQISVQKQSAMQYFAAVMLLSPFIGMLGARRPGATAWPWFIILPLIVVLQWPSLSQLMSETPETAIEIPTPTIVGFLFVLMMGAGNYLGTINTGAAFVTAMGIVLMTLPVSEWMSFDNRWCFPVGCLLLAFGASLLPGRYFNSAVETSSTPDGLDQLWTDFRDLFGIVWAKRVMDRVNQFADRENLAVRMTLDGFVGTDADRPAESAGRPTEILCWVLRRFLDAGFLHRYLADSSELRSGEQQQSSV